MGITLIYESLRPDPLTYASVHPIALSFYGISVSLNIILTLMIVARLVLHKRNIQNAMGTAHKPAGLYNVVATMLVESCALYAVTYLVYIVLWGTNNPAELMFYQLLIVSQVSVVCLRLRGAISELCYLTGRRIGHRPVPHR